MCVAAKFDPKFLETNDFAEALRPKQVGSSFIEGHNIFIPDFRKNPFLFAPDPGAVRPLIAFVTFVEETGPSLAIALTAQRFEVMFYFEQRLALSAVINHRIERISGSALRIDA